jgi:dihydroxy-acid dehydratase
MTKKAQSKSRPSKPQSAKPQSAKPEAAKPATGMRKGLTQYGDQEFSYFLRTAFIKGAGLSDDALARPVIGIANTGSGFNPCHGNAPQLIEAVKRGVMLAGGLPIDFPTISLHESFAQPTSMYLRNLMSIDTEEMIRAQPMDAVVLIGGCDKTVPAQLMGAASAGVPCIQLVTGAMLTGSHRGERVGACTDCRRFWGRYRAAEIDLEEITEVNEKLVASVGTCSVMGTASTMALVAEAMGMMVAGGASPPAVTADRIRVAEKTGQTAVSMARQALTPDKILTAKSFENGLRVLLAIGGSTNGLIHLTAIAGRAGIRIDFTELDQWARKTPVLVDLKPAGQHYMEDLHHAGGLATVLHELGDLIHWDALTVSGLTLRAAYAGHQPFVQQVVRPRSNPIYPEGGLAFLTGNLAPGGAIIKPSAASPALLEHEGRAVVFENIADLAARIDTDTLDVNADDVLVLKQIGPKGAPGMPEAGYLPIPRKLARRGVKDMLRISDGRMSGTAAGTVVLHVTPESAAGGPLALVENGDRIRLSTKRRELNLLVSKAELARREKARNALAAHVSASQSITSQPIASRGYAKLFQMSVLQADQGVDFDFLRPSDLQSVVPRKAGKS